MLILLFLSQETISQPKLMSQRHIEELSGKLAVIVGYQTTYVIIKVGDQKFRVNFFCKQEFLLRKGGTGQLHCLTDHPLLKDYNEQSVSIFINSKPKQFAKLNFDIQKSFNESMQGWRNWKGYVSNVSSGLSFETYTNNLHSGSGLVFDGPSSVAEKVIEVYEKYNVLTKSFTTPPKQKQFKLLLIGSNYVIADEFKIY